jgi:endonuclease/exonuclease/phosphatase family metal-dependent hydrolase
VLCWNVRGFRGGVDRAIAVVRGAAPDVVLLQESGRRSRLAAFAEALDLRVAADPPALFGRRVQDAVCVRRPWTIESRGFERFSGRSFWSPRGAAVADLGLGPGRVRAVSTHLGLHPRERAFHVEHLLAIVDGYDGPAIVGGDLNARPPQDAAMMLGERLRDVWEAAIAGGHTYPAGAPTARIDYVFVTGQIEVADADVLDTTVSDHRPVVADLELPGG